MSFIKQCRMWGGIDVGDAGMALLWWSPWCGQECSAPSLEVSKAMDGVLSILSWWGHPAHNRGLMLGDL